MTEQRTIESPASLSGVGLHTGAEVLLELLPGEVDSGVVFVRSDLPGEPRVEARLENLAFRPRRTALASGDAEVHTTEHLMAALWAAGIDNLLIRISGPELPGLDGSALPFYQAITEAGTVGQEKEARVVRLGESVGVQENGASIVAMPLEDESAPALKVGYTLDYTSTGLPSGARVGTQFFEAELSQQSFATEIAPARTFVLQEEVQMLRAEGLGKGANTQNTLVMGPEGLIENELRFPDEFVRHKVLDLIGDLYLMGFRLHGCILAARSGHALNVRLAKRLVHLLGDTRTQTQATNAAPRSTVAPTSRPPNRSARRNGGGATKSGETRASDAANAYWERREREVAKIWEHSEDGIEAAQIERLIPHRYPFLLVDRVVEIQEDRRAIGLKNVTYNEEFFRGHFPRRPMMPGVLQVEAMAQLGGLLLLSRPENVRRLALLLTIDRVKFRRAVIPGDQLVLEADLRKHKTRTAEVTTKATVNLEVVAEARMKFKLVDRDGDEHHGET